MRRSLVALMSTKWTFGILISVGVTGLWAVLVSCSRGGPHPPVVKLVSIEPAGMVDEGGKEVCLLTLAVSNDNPANRPGGNENTLYVADSARGVEVRMG